jgi:hypothetical protein
MAEDTTATRPRLLAPELFRLLEAHRAACGQTRTFQRLVALVLGHLCAFGRQTITQALVALGLVEHDWSAFYRLFAVPRLRYDRLTRCFVREWLTSVPTTGPVVAVIDAVQLPRASGRMPGTSWLHAPRTPPFRRGIHRAQRFEHLAGLLPRSASGYSRALPLRLDPAFPAKARPAAGVAPCTEWEAGLEALRWLRAEVDAAGRAAQRLLAVSDGAYSGKEVWRDLPERVDLLARCARNRALWELPAGSGARGRPRLYGARAPRPDSWLAVSTGWQHATLLARGRSIPLTYRVEGPYLVRGAARRPLLLLIVKGVAARQGRRRRDPTFWLVSAVPDGAGGWMVPWPASDLLAWAWQRWEIEVTHRELKSEFGLGETQCWGPVSAVLAVQWVAWAYAVLVLAGYRAWGMTPGPVPPPGRWWPGAKRWSLGRLWQGLRQELWQEADFRPVWSRTPDTWGEMSDWLAARTNATLGSRRG